MSALFTLADLEAYKADGTGREGARTWKAGFFLGAAEVIGKRLREAMAQFASGPGHALVPFNAGLVKDAVKRVFPHLQKGFISSRSYDGRSAGRQAGGNMALRPHRKLTSTLALTQG